MIKKMNAAFEAYEAIAKMDEEQLTVIFETLVDNKPAMADFVQHVIGVKFFEANDKGFLEEVAA